MPTITSFPNKKTTLNYDEFCELYDQAYKTSVSDDGMISAIFDMFDYDKYSAYNTQEWEDRCDQHQADAGSVRVQD